jgi:hypothetical protein
LTDRAARSSSASSCSAPGSDRRPLWPPLLPRTANRRWP